MFYLTFKPEKVQRDGCYFRLCLVCGGEAREIWLKKKEKRRENHEKLSLFLLGNVQSNKKKKFFFFFDVVRCYVYIFFLTLSRHYMSMRGKRWYNKKI